MQRHIRLPTTSGTGRRKRAVEVGPTNRGQDRGFPATIHLNMNATGREGATFVPVGGGLLTLAWPMIEGEARFPGGTPLIRALTMQRSIEAASSLVGKRGFQIARFIFQVRLANRYGMRGRGHSPRNVVRVLPQ